ncbi:MAG TPA: hypothetical protein VNH53_03930 [Sphingomicrobium sp.]|jgi:hypothetical protein|nr:hypothetical protein [Sphingomicrobium sp.]
MIGDANASALTVSALAAWAADELRFAGFNDDEAGVRETAGECVAPLLRASIAAIELSGLLSQEQSAAVRDIMAGYLGAGHSCGVATGALPEGALQ